MVINTKKNSIVFGLTTSKTIAEKVSKISGIELGKYKSSNHRDGEIFIESETSVRGKSVFIIQSISKPANDNLMELLLFVDALKRSSAKEINLVIPYYGYSRQDRKVFGRQPISAKLVANLLAVSGASRVITFDIHSEQIVGFFDIPFDNLRAQGVIAKELSNLEIEDLTIVSPDHGGVSRARQLAQKMNNAPLAVVDKRRLGNDKVESMFILGDVKDRNIVIYDDMVDSGTTVKLAIKIMKNKGAKNIYLAATHSILSHPSGNSENLLNELKLLGLKMIITTNSIPQKENPFLNIIDLSQIISETIINHIENKSITDHFIKKYNTKL